MCQYSSYLSIRKPWILYYESRQWIRCLKSTTKCTNSGGQDTTWNSGPEDKTYTPEPVTNVLFPQEFWIIKFFISRFDFSPRDTQLLYLLRRTSLHNIWAAGRVGPGQDFLWPVSEVSFLEHYLRLKKILMKTQFTLGLTAFTSNVKFLLKPCF